MPAEALKPSPLPALEQLQTTALTEKTAEEYLAALRRIGAPDDVLELAEAVSARMVEAQRAIRAGHLDYAKTLLDTAQQLNNKAQAKVDALARRFRSRRTP